MDCPTCGVQIAAEDNFCRNCGAQLGTRQAPQPSETIALMMAEYRRQVVERPDDANARHSLGLACLYAGDFASARGHFERVVELEPRFADGHAKLATALARLGEVEAARAALARGLQLAPGSAELRALARRLGVA